MGSHMFSFVSNSNSIKFPTVPNFHFILVSIFLYFYEKFPIYIFSNFPVQGYRHCPL